MIGNVRLSSLGFARRNRTNRPWTQIKMEDAESIRIDEINGFLTFLRNIEWKDPWLVGLIIFHVAVTMITILTRNHGNFQVALFLVLLSLVYFSESINELAASYWNLFSRQQYFDSKGMFISLVFSAPILMNCMVLVASWLYQSGQLMTKLKQAQLRAEFSKQNEKKSLNESSNKSFRGPLSYANSELLNRLRHRSEKQNQKPEEVGCKTLDATGLESST